VECSLSRRCFERHPRKVAQVVSKRGPPLGERGNDKEIQVGPLRGHSTRERKVRNQLSLLTKKGRYRRTGEEEKEGERRKLLKKKGPWNSKALRHKDLWRSEKRARDDRGGFPGGRIPSIAGKQRRLQWKKRDHCHLPRESAQFARTCFNQ